MSRTRNQLLHTAIVAALSFTAFTPMMASAQATNPDYLTNYPGTVVKSGFGLCWHTTSWTEASSAVDCDAPIAAAAAPVAPIVMAAAPMAAAPAAAAPVSASREIRKVTFSAEELFDFDKSVLKPAGKKGLDQLTADLAGVTYTNIAVTGHTDRLGTPEYNQKLSERRANTVMTYLVAQGVQGSKITAAGVGETQPTTKDCKGPKSKALIACLQPDRRVEVSVTGSQQVASK
ncbi:OmpA family protein [Lacisediminimonas profundi]|uniref:OmpA family protein n=1 Tax=Lacisediminimonas profundi TaxID=2603856 RepID=UPI00124B736A|nr:OmpA family protein [Lacisediminimonas profundi]